MLTGSGRRPVAKAFDASLTLYAEHELNASTFTTRVITSTHSDMHSAVAGGVGALKGPLHGGAGEAVMRTLWRSARSPTSTRSPTRRSPRSGGSWASAIACTRRATRARPSCAAWPRRRAASPGQFKWYEMAVKLHERINAAKGLIPNVDFYSAPLFYSLGIPVDLFTPVIAAGRIAGWTANIIEQHADNRLIRPARRLPRAPARACRSMRPPGQALSRCAAASAGS